MASEDIKELNFFTTNEHERTRTRIKCRITSLLCLCGSWLLFLLLFISCQTAPQTLQMPEAYLQQGVLPLDKGASVYLVADVKESRAIINLLPIKELKDSNVRQMIDRSNFAMAAVFPANSGKRFQITAWGNYPKSGAGMALGSNKNWIKQRNENGVEYWHSAADRISLSLTAKNLYVVSSINDKPANPLAAGAEIPEGFADFSRGAVFSCWVNSPAAMLQQILSRAGVPITIPVLRLFVNLNTSSGTANRYEANIRLGLENASQARGLAAILRIAGSFTSNDPSLQIAMLLLSNPPVQNDRNLEIKIYFSTLNEVIDFINNIAGIIQN